MRPIVLAARPNIREDLEELTRWINYFEARQD